jgi:hypothetical protein
MPAVAVLVDVGILLALAVLIGLRFGYTYTLGKVLLMSAALLNTVVIPTPFGNIRLLGFAADALLKADHAIMHTLGRGITDMQAAWNEAVSYTARQSIGSGMKSRRSRTTPPQRSKGCTSRTSRTSTRRSTLGSREGRRARGTRRGARAARRPRRHARGSRGHGEGRPR